MNELITDPGLRNWIKACLGLKCVRDGMLPFMERKCEDLYSNNETFTKTITKLTTYSCSVCCVKDVQPSHSMKNCPAKGQFSRKTKCACTSKNKKLCPNGGACGFMYDRIMDDHVNMTPRWDNTDCQKWYLNGWEQMKCFIDIPGYKEKALISQADVTAFVHICQNNKTLCTIFKSHLGKLLQVRSDRNEIYHSGDLVVTDDKLKEYFANMQAVLKIVVFNAFTTDIQEQLDKLAKLEADVGIEVNTVTEIEARKEALNALIEDTRTLEERNKNTPDDNPEASIQQAQYAVLQDTHMRSIADHLKRIKEEFNLCAKVLLEQSSDLKSITAGVHANTKAFETLQKELVQQSELIRGIEVTTVDTNIVVTKSYRTLKDVECDVKTILLIFKELIKYNRPHARNINGTVVAEIKGVPNEKHLSNEIVQTMRSRKFNPDQEANSVIDNALMEDIIKAVETDGDEIIDVRPGSIIIKILCPSMSNWIHMCEQCIDGRMTQRFKPLQDLLRKNTSLANLTITVDMLETDFIESVDTIVKQLYPHMIAVLPHNLAMHRQDGNEHSNVQDLNAMLKCLLDKSYQSSHQKPCSDIQIPRAHRSEIPEMQIESGQTTLVSVDHTCMETKTDQNKQPATSETLSVQTTCTGTQTESQDKMETKTDLNETPLTSETLSVQTNFKGTHTDPYVTEDATLTEVEADMPVKPTSPTPIQSVKKTCLDKKVLKRNARGEMPINLAAINGDIKLLKKLIKAGSDVNVADFAGWTPLHEASNRGWFSVTKHLLKAGANVNVQGFENDTPLHDAAINGHKKLVQLLLKHGANPLQQNAKGKTALDVASSPEMVRVLKKEIICSASDSSSIEDLRSPNSPDSVNSYKDDDKSVDGDDLNHHNDRHNSFSTDRRMSIGAPKSPGDSKLASPRLCLKFHRDHLGQTSHKSMVDSTYSVTNISVSAEVDLFSPVDSPASSVDSDLVLGLTNSTSLVTTSNRVKITVPDDDSLDSNQSHDQLNYQNMSTDSALSCDSGKQSQTREVWPEQTVSQNNQSDGDVTFSSNSFPYSLKADSKITLQSMGSLPFQPSSLQFDDISSQEDEDSLLPDLEIETEKSEKSIPESEVDYSNSKVVLNSFKDVLNSLSSTSLTLTSGSVSSVSNISNISNISPVMESIVSSNSATVADSQDIRQSAGDCLEPEPLSVVSSSESIPCVSDSDVKSVSMNEELTEKTTVSSDNDKNQNSDNHVTELTISEKTGNQSDIVRACSPISPEIDVTSSRPNTPKVPPLKIIIPPKSQSALSTPTCSEMNDGLKLVVTNVKSALPYVINPYQNHGTAEMVKNSDSKLTTNHVQTLVNTFEYLSNNKSSSNLDERSHFPESVLRKEVLNNSSNGGNSGVQGVTTDTTKYNEMEGITSESYALMDSANDGSRGISVECENGSVDLDSLTNKSVKSETDAGCRDDSKKGDTSQRVLRSTVRSQLNSNVSDSKAVRAPKTSQERAQEKLEKMEKNNGVDSSISPSVSPEPEISSSRTGKDEEDVDLLPRKRKFRRQDGNQTSMEADNGPELEPLNPTLEKVPNPFELYLNLRKKIASRRCGYLDRVTICPKSPQGFKDYLLKTCNYVLQGNSASMLSVPTLSPPNSVKDKMRDLFVSQEECRYKLRLQHLIEREKVKLSIEQEILREHGRWARALVNQGTPLSVCTILRDEEIYNFTEDQEEKDKRNRTRFNGRQFLSWIQDVDDKYEKIKELLILRQKQEADSLWAYQKLEWEWRMKELVLCERNANPEIDDLHVPTVVVSDNFELRPT